MRRDFLPYLQTEIVALGDPSMEQEVQTLLKLIAAPSTGPEAPAASVQP